MMGDSDKSRSERRRYPRVVAPVLYRAPKHASPKRPVSDMSLGGVRIFSDEHLEVGERLELEFFLPDGLSVRAIAKVAWIKEMSEKAEALYDLGMEFVEMSDEVKEKLREVLKG